MVRSPGGEVLGIGVPLSLQHPLLDPAGPRSHGLHDWFENDAENKIQHAGRGAASELVEHVALNLHEKAAASECGLPNGSLHRSDGI